MQWKGARAHEKERKEGWKMGMNLCWPLNHRASDEITLLLNIVLNKANCEAASTHTHKRAFSAIYGTHPREKIPDLTRVKRENTESEKTKIKLRIVWRREELKGKYEMLEGGKGLNHSTWRGKERGWWDVYEKGKMKDPNWKDRQGQAVKRVKWSADYLNGSQTEDFDSFSPCSALTVPESTNVLICDRRKISRESFKV